MLAQHDILRAATPPRHSSRSTRPTSPTAGSTSRLPGQPFPVARLRDAVSGPGKCPSPHRRVMEPAVAQRLRRPRWPQEQVHQGVQSPTFPSSPPSTIEHRYMQLRSAFGKTWHLTRQFLLPVMPTYHLKAAYDVASLPARHVAASDRHCTTTRRNPIESPSLGRRQFQANTASASRIQVRVLRRKEMGRVVEVGDVPRDLKVSLRLLSLGPQPLEDLFADPYDISILRALGDDRAARVTRRQPGRRDSMATEAGDEKTANRGNDPTHVDSSLTQGSLSLRRKRPSANQRNRCGHSKNPRFSPGVFVQHIS